MIIVQDLKRIGVAFSGGPDSLALTLMLSKVFGPKRILALTVNHNLPGFGEEPIDKIAALLEPHQISHKIIHLEWPENTLLKSSKQQELARSKRYEAFFSICQQENVPLLLTGHHLDDDLITFFYRFSRMSGIDGLASMKPYTILPLIQNDGQIPILVGRPLLSIPKSRLLDTCRSLGVDQWIQDPENSELSYLRNRVRDALIQIQKSLPDELHTTKLASMLYNFKKHRQEAQDQTTRLVNESVLLDSSCIKTSGMNPSSGDAVLVCRPDSSWWFRNVYLVTRLLTTLIQYVSNTAAMSGYYTIFSYCKQLCESLKTRKRRDERIGRIRQHIPSMSFPSYSKTGMNVNMMDPTRRLPFITTFNISGVNVYPLGGRDTLQRLELSSKYPNGRNESNSITGPGILLCRTTPKRSLIQQYRHDFDMLPGVRYLWDNRIFIQYQYNDISNAKDVIHLPEIESFKLISKNKSSKTLDIMAPSIGGSSRLGSQELPYIVQIHKSYLIASQKGERIEPPSNQSTSILKIRISFLTIDALKHMAMLAKAKEDEEFFDKLEQFKVTCPSTLLYHHPLLINLETGDMILPTVGLALYLGNTIQTWTANTAGQAHFYNKLVSPSFIDIETWS